MSLKVHNEIADAIKMADTSYFYENYSHQAHAVMKTLEKKGYAIVPKQPTEEMLKAGAEAILPGKTHPDELAKGVFQAMLATGRK